MVQRYASRVFLLAAVLWLGFLPPALALRSPASGTSAAASFPPENRVGGSDASPSGRLSLEGAQSPENTTGLEGFAYESASGRRIWLNRDPLGDNGSLVFAVEKMQPKDENKLLTMAQVLRISVDELAGVNANMYEFVANEPLTKVDPLGLDWLDCMAKCIEKNDPLNAKCKIGLGALGGTLPYRWVRPIFGQKLGTPLTTVPSTIGKVIGGSAEGCLRKIGRACSPAMVGYGLGMAGIEAACTVQCASDSKSFDW